MVLTSIKIVIRQAGKQTDRQTNGGRFYCCNVRSRKTVTQYRSRPLSIRVLNNDLFVSRQPPANIMGFSTGMPGVPVSRFSSVP